MLPIAFLGLIPLNEILIMVITQAILKSLYEVVALPVTVRVVKYIKKVEGTEVFDHDLSYNPLKVKDL